MLTLRTIAISALIATTPSTVFSSEGRQLPITTGIVGGEAVTRDSEWPSTVAVTVLSKDSKISSFCGGTVVAPTWVLTAAHCLYLDEDNDKTTPPTRITESQIKVIANFSNGELAAALGDTEKQETVTAIYENEDFDFFNKVDPFNKDIALLELAQKVENPPMPIFKGVPEAGSMATVSGWGTFNVDANYNGDGPLSLTSIREVSIPIVTNEECNNVYGGIINKYKMCAGDPKGGKDSCQGDSGGPLTVVQGGVKKQVGIVSFGEGCGKPGAYGAYTRLSALADWVNQYIPGLIDPNGGSIEDLDAWRGQLLPNNGEFKKGGGSMGLGMLISIFGAVAFRKNRQKEDKRCKIKDKW